MTPPAVYSTLPTSALDRLLSEAAASGIDPLWILAALAAEARDSDTVEAS